VRLALRDPFTAPRVVRNLAVSLGGGYYVSDWTRNHANFFRSIEITKSMLFVILMLVVAVAAFNIVAALVMVVKESAATSRSCVRSVPRPAAFLLCFRSRGPSSDWLVPQPVRCSGSRCPPISNRWCMRWSGYSAHIFWMQRCTS
jgi:hypothetical protein